MVFVLLIASAVVAFAFAKWWPMQVDAGWYSYPGYALSEGRDPSENMLPPASLPLDKPGIRSLFPWENRSFLLVRLYAMWFSVAGHSQISLACFGIFMWLGLSALIGLAVWIASRNKWATTAAVLAATTDSMIIKESMADLRPDVPLAIVAVGALCCLLWFLRRPNAGAWLVSGLLLGTLPLVHTTGVLPLGALLATVGLIWVFAWGRRDHARLSLIFLIAIALAAVLFRQPIVDVLIPTHVPLEFEKIGRHDMAQRWHEMLDAGVLVKVTHELERWKGYFANANIAQFAFLITGLAGLVAPGDGNPKRGFHLNLLAGWIAGVALISLLDPHFTSTHMIPLVSLGYAYAGIGWGRWLERGFASMRGAPQILLAALCCLGMIVKSAEAVHLVHKGAANGVTHAEITELLSRALPPTPGTLWAFAPTSIWLYLPSGGTTVLVDQRGKRNYLDSEAWPRISVLIVDSDFLGYGWRKTIDDGIACGNLHPIGRVGDADVDAIYYLEAFQVLHVPRCETR